MRIYMEEIREFNNNDSFQQFNQAREVLAQQFYEMISIVGNQVFPGQIDATAINLMEEINRQENLVEPEKNVLKQLYFYANNLTTSRFLLGVLGRFKSGKSTILNALSGADISPMDTRISTGVLNFTYRSEQEECHVVYDNGQESPISVADKILYVDFRHNPDNEKGIHSVRHGSPTLDLQKEIIFVDTPGLEAVNQVHEKITLDFVSQCHAAVVVSTYPPFGLTELQFYDRIKGTIPNVFLVQNLPADKIIDWIKLEAQTLENLHKLGFYQLNTEIYGQQDLRHILHQISDRQDEKALARFKKEHNIHLYSINAKAAYEAIVLNQPRESEAKFDKLRQSRFLFFKTELYEFLAKHKGNILLQDYLQKGKVMLKELISLVIGRQQLMRKSLNEISQQIKDQSEKQNKAVLIVNGLMDRSTVKITESYKNFKNQVMDKDLVALIEELNKDYGKINVFRLHGPDIKAMKVKVIEFNRILGQNFQAFVKEMREIIQDTQEKISENIESHGIFSRLEIRTEFNQISLGEISGAGYIDYGFEILFRGTLAYLFGSLIGGFTFLLLPVSWWTLLGIGIGVGVSIPLGKYCKKALDFSKDVLSKLIHRSTQTVFDQFRNDVRTRLDEIERDVLDPALQNLKAQVLQNTTSFFELFKQRLQELQNRKAHGMTQQMCEQECQKYQNVIEQLQNIQDQFEKNDDVSEITGKVQNLFKGIKGYLKKFRK